MSYALADLEAVTKVPRRTLQFWSDAGVIMPDQDTRQAGRGVYRRYSRDEAIIACYVRALSQMKLPVGELRQIAITFRMNLPRFRQVIDKKIDGKADLLCITAHGGSQWSGQLVEMTISSEKRKKMFKDSMGLLHLPVLSKEGGVVSAILSGTYIQGIA
jgi:DNA-binding transcriptional MerR regulator